MIIVLLSFVSFACYGLTPMEQIWQQFYIKNLNFRIESVSGGGSSLAQTEQIRKTLPLLFEKLNVGTILDAPCGDFNWAHAMELTSIIRYYGVDVVDIIIDSNQRKYGNRKYKFLKADITKDTLPKADLILCRDCLVHLSNSDVFAALKNFKSTGAMYLLTTHFPNHLQNYDIETSGNLWRPINLQKPPFNLPDPLLIFEEGFRVEMEYADKSLALWRLQDIILPE